MKINALPVATPLSSLDALGLSQRGNLLCDDEQLDQFTIHYIIKLIVSMETER